MEDKATLSPTPRASGTFGEELVVLSLSVIRTAEKLDCEQDFETLDGFVRGRPGDFVITSSTGERYPILAQVFYGAYEILGRAGSRYICRRLLHARRAWPIESAEAVFDYGPGRGKVSGERGGWIYQSDLDDYGLIGKEEKGRAHVVVGALSTLKSLNWANVFQYSTLALSLMPPVMTLVALIGFEASIRDQESLSTSLSVIEAFALVCGTALAWYLRTAKWGLRAVLASENVVAQKFQRAAQLLGQKPSDQFPSMVLWRAAQLEDAGVSNVSPELIREVKKQVSETYEHVSADLADHHAEKRRASVVTWLSVLAIVGCTAYTIWSRSFISELIAIWLPSVVGAINNSLARRSIVNRIGSSKEFLSQLAFVRTHLLSLVPNDTLDLADASMCTSLAAVLRLLCRAAAEHEQRELRFALAQDPEIPL